jgi:hypothetical protein
VLIEGAFTQEAEQTAVQLASRLAVQRLALWLGPSPAWPDRCLWRPLDAGQGVLAALASAAPLVAARLD